MLIPVLLLAALTIAAAALALAVIRTARREIVVGVVQCRICSHRWIAARDGEVLPPNLMCPECRNMSGDGVEP